MAPTAEPKQLIDPIHDNAVWFNGPDSRGVVCDINVDKTGLSQPITQPCDTETKFAVKKSVNFCVMRLFLLFHLYLIDFPNTYNCGVVLLPNVSAWKCFCC